MEQEGGGTTDWFPADALDLAHVQPIYETLPGWNDDISKATSFDQLPKNAQNYLARLEHHIGVPIKFVSIGPARHQTLIR